MKTALGIMLILAGISAFLWVFGMFPFTRDFGLAFVGIPTIGLVIAWLKWKPIS